MRASVIVPVYNEEQNIAALLRRITAEANQDVTLDDVIVVASGCTDGTVAQASAVQQLRPEIRILVQEQREGKASAINLALQAAKHDMVVLVSGDVMPAPGSVRALLRCLDDPAVGVTGGRPVPMNDASTFTGFAAHLLWRLHHVINLQTPDNPKCGEMIAFRRRMDGRWLVPAIPGDSAVDEVSIEALIHEQGLLGRYDGDAIVHTWGPSSLRDWFIQRRRINAGHIIYAGRGYKPSTMRVGSIAAAFARDPLARRRPLWVLATVSIDMLARVAGRFDLLRGERHTVWKVAGSTKRAMALPAVDDAAAEVDVIPAELLRTPSANGSNGAHPVAAPSASNGAHPVAAPSASNGVHPVEVINVRVSAGSREGIAD